MTPEKLVRMANQIGAYFVADPQPQHARQQIAEHLRRFWTPAMRRTLVDTLDHGAAGAPGLNELVAQAVVEHRELLVGCTTEQESH